MHISLYVSNIENTKDFYSTFFGQEPTKQETGYLKYELKEPCLVISMVENPASVHQNFGHLGFRVEDESTLKEKLQSAVEKGFKITEEMDTNCCYAKQDKFWVSDPDGIQWETYVFHEDVEFNDPQFSSILLLLAAQVAVEKILNRICKLTLRFLGSVR